MMPAMTGDLLEERVELLRASLSVAPGRTERAALGQFLTPLPTARLMAAMFGSAPDALRLLDPGAGIGSLTAAVVANLVRRDVRPRAMHVTTYEVDQAVIGYLRDTLDACGKVARSVGMEFSADVREEDFVRSVAPELGGLFRADQPYDWVIVNPPYRKLAVASDERKMLRSADLDAGNLYAAFVLLCAELLGSHGQLVAITPRSFANGPYFRTFRRRLFERVVLRRLHLFHARDRAFRDDRVLQENVVYMAERAESAQDAVVVIGSGMDASDEYASEHVVPLSTVVAQDHDRVLFLPDTEEALRVVDRMASFHKSLGALGLSVSTGPVVDFRARAHLRATPGTDTVPLLYPVHLKAGRLRWPANGNKPNALVRGPETEALLVPGGTYVLVKRFSAKEEARRLVASVVEPADVAGSDIAIENHLNYFHVGGAGLPRDLAYGLAAYLNSAMVDDYFRLFSGHTQVNANDLRMLPYPTRDELCALGDEGRPSRSGAGLSEELRRMVDGPDTAATAVRINEALDVLESLGMPRAQLNERSALALLALLGLGPTTPWSEATDPPLGITPMMEIFAEQYGKRYAPNTRETVRRQTVHQFLDAGFIVQNPDQPDRPTNSGKTVYRVEAGALELFRSYGGPDWDDRLAAYKESVGALRERYAREREMVRIPVRLGDERLVTLSAGGQNVLIRLVIEDFGSRFVPGGQVLYIGDADEKWMLFEESELAALGVQVDAHGKMPDVVLYDSDRNWLFLVEAVTSHGPVDAKRRAELETLFEGSSAGLVFVTAFLDRRAMVRFLGDISWETEVWVAESPSHLIHFNGERFLGPFGAT